MNNSLFVHQKLVTSCIIGLVGALVATGCAAEPTDADSSPGAEADTLEMQASLPSAGWTSTANPPSIVITGYNSYINQYIYEARASANFTRQSGATERKIGVCLLKVSETWQTCDTKDTCPNAFATGGSKYCYQIDGAGPKYCMFKIGASSSYCAGSPADGGQTHGPGYLQTPAVSYGSGPGAPNWLSNACFEGCGDGSASISSSTRNAPESGGGGGGGGSEDPCGGGPMCGSVCC